MPLRDIMGRGLRASAVVAAAAAVLLAAGGWRAGLPGALDAAGISVGQARSSAVSPLVISGNFGTAEAYQSPSTKRLALGSGAQTVSISVANLTTPAISLAGDGLDNDGDGLIDEDPVTGVDEDGDGQKDEDPTEAIDSDADGQADEDPPAGQIASDDDNDGREGGPSSAAGTCDDQLDNDGTGGRDMADPDCAGTGENAVIDEDPARGKDGDGDGKVDEDSPDDDAVGEGGLKTVSGNTAANPTVITTSAAHNLAVGNVITISGSNSTPKIDGTWIVATVPSATKLTLTSGPNVTVAGTAGAVAAPMNCVDGIDNDGDAYVDRNDVECNGDGKVDEDPINGVDDDGDGRTDEDGKLSDCLSNGFTAVTCPFNQDRDGTTGSPKVDEDGPNDDMDGTGRESGTGADNCSDNVDNDGDGAVDGYDPQCLQRVDEDGRNEDGDGNESTGSRYPATCADGLDNDGSGGFDDADPSCAAYLDEDGGTDTDADGRFDEDGRDDDRDGTQDEDGPLPCLVNDANPAAGTVGCGLGAYRVRITYDPAIVQFSSAANGSFLTSSGRTLQACTTTTGPGWVEYACSTSAVLGNPATNVGPQGAGVLATVKFASLSMGDSALDLTGTEVYDVRGRQLDVTLSSGIASVGRCGDVPLPVHGITHNADDDGDGGVDEDPVNGVDNDGDGRTDEDPAFGVVNGVVGAQDAQAVFAFWKKGLSYTTDYNSNGASDGLEYDRYPVVPNGAVGPQDAQYVFALLGQSCASAP